MTRTSYIYILASQTRELYVGVTNLQRRLAEHRGDQHPDSYCFRHRTTRLVYYEWTYDVRSAIKREKRLKRLSRRKKLRLMEDLNPDWRDLASIEGW